MTRQLFCHIHNAGPFNDASIQKQKHEDEFSSCIWESYNPQKHIPNFIESEIVSVTEEREHPSRAVYDFIKSQIKKLVVSDDDANQVYVLIENNGHVETWDVNGNQTRDWFRYRYFKETGKNHSDDIYKNALSLIKSEAVLDNGQRVTIHNRIAMDGKTIYYDLASPEFKGIKITEKSVEIINLNENTPIFVRTQHQKQQVMPKFDKKYTMSDLSQLWRIPQKDRHFFQVHSIALFIENCAAPIMNILGEHGSNKTTLAKSVKRLVDPSGNNISSFPSKTQDLVLHFNNRYLASFDNVSYLSQTVSDILCRAITGDGQSKRQHYENSLEIIYHYRRKIILNGIAPSLEYNDYRDRSVFYETLPLKEYERLTEEEYNNRFENLVPYILGEIFNVLQNSLQMYDSVKLELKKLPRLADFAVYGECISRALGYEPLSFLVDYQERISTNNLGVIESYPIIRLMEKMMEGRDKYEDTITAFYKTILQLADTESIDVHSKSIKFPVATNKIRQHIQKIRSNLREVGFEIDIYQYKKRDGKHSKNHQIVVIDRIGSPGTLLQHVQETSLPPLPSLPPQKPEQNSLVTGNDTVSTSQVLEVSSPEIPRKHEQNSPGKGGNDGNDTQNSSGEHVL